jgi:hypothetical protein
MRVAAIQLQTVIGDIDANLAACEKLARVAAGEGAEWILLPEFFTTGMGFLPELVQRSLPPDGAATALLRTLAMRHKSNLANTRRQGFGFRNSTPYQKSAGMCRAGTGAGGTGDMLHRQATMNSYSTAASGIYLDVDGTLDLMKDYPPLSIF